MSDRVRDDFTHDESVVALPAPLDRLDSGTDLRSLHRQLAPSLRILLDEKLFSQVRSLAKIMAADSVFTPRHLRGKEAGCFTVISNALTWNLDYGFVARCTYETPGGSIGFMGKLIQAVLEQSGRFVGGPKISYVGDWSKVLGKFKKQISSKGHEFVVPAWDEKSAEGLGIIVRWRIKGEDEDRVWPGEDDPFYLLQCYPLNSPLWATDPRTQIRYLAIRRFADNAAPGVLAGLPFDTDDLVEASERAREITPAEGAPPRPTREQFQQQEKYAETVVEPEPEFEIADHLGEVVRYADAQPALDAYGHNLDVAERLGSSALATVWENNAPLLDTVERKGWRDVALAIKKDYGVRLKQVLDRERHLSNVPEPSDGVSVGTQARLDAAGVAGAEREPETAEGTHRPADADSEDSEDHLGLSGSRDEAVRSPFWESLRYIMQPPMSHAGREDWPRYADNIARMVGEARTSAELDKFLTDSGAWLDLLQRSDPRAHARASAAISDKRAALTK